MAKTIGEDCRHRSGPLVEKDPYLAPYAPIIDRRISLTEAACRRLADPAGSLARFANGHTYFGLHRQEKGWVFREWAPHATEVFFVGTLSGWRVEQKFALTRINETGVWEINLPGDKLAHGDLYRLRICWDSGSGDRIPAWARRVVQDPETLIFNAQVWEPEAEYRWRVLEFTRPADPPLIYEAHVGMAQAEERIGTYTEFADRIIPRIAAAGYNTLQLMAIQEHPYYGSFGYHVSSFFAAASRFGTPEELKRLIDTAHSRGLSVIMDLVHSHAVANEVEGLGRFDGTDSQYFHEGPRGWHDAWGSRCFDYGKTEVIRFLLSNCRFWLEEYRVDGFRFDGVTSMLYRHHGLETAFVSYEDYYDDSVDEEALVYLTLANQIIHELRPDAATVAEDVSGMPGLAMPASKGGMGFDYRLSMGIPDCWIRLTKDTADENWPMGYLWHELTNRRAEERTIGYAESHDQALVGDQTLMFRMAGSDMYHAMAKGARSLQVERAMALHKMIRLITLATAGSGYLNFMGNEFGHPEWIDFPREENGWSYRYARRQWHLVDDPDLRYHLLADFDQAMIDLARQCHLLSAPEPRLLHEHDDEKILAFERAGLMWVFNFHPVNSYTDYEISTHPGKYRMVLDSDDPAHGGHGRLAAGQIHFTRPDKKGHGNRHLLSLYLPTRTALVLAPEHRMPVSAP